LFIYGNFELIKNTYPTVFIFEKIGRADTDVAITVLNFSGEEAEFVVPAGY